MPTSRSNRKRSSSSSKTRARIRLNSHSRPRRTSKNKKQISSRTSKRRRTHQVTNCYGRSQESYRSHVGMDPSLIHQLRLRRVVTSGGDDNDGYDEPIPAQRNRRLPLSTTVRNEHVAQPNMFEQLPPEVVAHIIQNVPAINWSSTRKVNDIFNASTPSLETQVNSLQNYEIDRIILDWAYDPTGDTDNMYNLVTFIRDQDTLRQSIRRTFSITDKDINSMFSNDKNMNSKIFIVNDIIPDRTQRLKFLTSALLDPKKDYYYQILYNTRDLRNHPNTHDNATTQSSYVAMMMKGLIRQNVFLLFVIEMTCNNNQLPHILLHENDIQIASRIRADCFVEIRLKVSTNNNESISLDSISWPTFNGYIYVHSKGIDEDGSRFEAFYERKVDDDQGGSEVRTM